MMNYKYTLLASVSLLAFGCKASPSEDESSPTAVNVKTIVVKAQPYTETVGAIGTVTARAGHIASLSAPAPARIAQVLVSVGQRVVVGTKLVILDQAPFRDAARAAEAALTAAQRAYDRAKNLSDAGIIPRKDLDQATADLAKARNDVSIAHRAEALSVIRSPINGVVTEMVAVLGSSADVAQPLVEIADPSALDIVLGTPPVIAAKIRPGNKVQLRAGQNSSGESLGIGTVIAIGATVDSSARSVAIRASLPAAVRPLRIGETIYGDIAVATRNNTIIVPVEALIPEGDLFHVFVVDAKNVAHARPVTVGARNQKAVEILKGLSSGERVVTYGAYGLDDGVTVVPTAQ